MNQQARSSLSFSPLGQPSCSMSTVGMAEVGRATSRPLPVGGEAPQEPARREFKGLARGEKIGARCDRTV